MPLASFVEFNGGISVDDLSDLNIHWKEGARNVTIIAKDQDTGLTPSGINYNITQFDGSIAKSLDEQYNFEDRNPDKEDRFFP
jgi:hypothetical protein